MTGEINDGRNAVEYLHENRYLEGVIVRYAVPDHIAGTVLGRSSATGLAALREHNVP